MNQFPDFKMQYSLTRQSNSSLLGSLAPPTFNSKSSDLFDMLRESPIEEYTLPYLKGDFEIDFGSKDLSDITPTGTDNLDFRFRDENTRQTRSRLSERNSSSEREPLAPLHPKSVPRGHEQDTVSDKTLLKLQEINTQLWIKLKKTEKERDDLELKLFNTPDKQKLIKLNDENSALKSRITSLEEELAKHKEKSDNLEKKYNRILQAAKLFESRSQDLYAANQALNARILGLIENGMYD